MRGFALAGFVLALCVAAPAEAYNRKAAKAHEEGLKAVEAGRWSEARGAFEQALSLDDTEGRIRVSGVKYMDYYPSLGLAEAALELGDHDAARAALARFDRIKKPGAAQSSQAAALRSRLAGPATPAAPGSASGPAPEAVAAKRALDEGDLAGARRLARSAPTDALAQEVLGAVDALLADRLTAARRDQGAGALGAAQEKLESVLVADPGNSAAMTLLESVKADAGSARELLSDARAALDAERYDEAEDLARQARTRDGALADEARSLEREVSSARRSAPTRQAQAPASGPRAGELLKAARGELDGGRLAQARAKASDALAADAKKKAEVEALRRAIAQRAGEADEALRAARSAVGGGRFVDARRQAGKAERLDRGLAGDARTILDSADEGEAQAGRLIAKIEAHLESGSAASARSVTDELAQAFPEHPELAGLRASVDGSGELVAGLRAYFRGDWSASIDGLTPLLADNPGRSDLLAVLGSAHATRGLLRDGEEGTADLARARELFAQALAADPALSLDARYFSPRVRAVFDSARGG